MEGGGGWFQINLLIGVIIRVLRIAKSLSLEHLLRVLLTSYLLYRTMANMSMVKIKWEHHGAFRRFEVPLENGYEMLLKKVKVAVPDFQEQLAWKGCYFIV